MEEMARERKEKQIEVDAHTGSVGRKATEDNNNNRYRRSFNGIGRARNKGSYFIRLSGNRILRDGLSLQDL